jgi:LCP family protein required for cell wall assembly
MNDRPTDFDGDEPAYDWLYPTHSHGVGQNNAPEETRILPPGSASRTKGRPLPGTEPIPGPVKPLKAAKAKKSGKPKRRWIKRVLWLIPVLVVAWIAFLIAVPIMALNDVTRIDFTPAGDRPAEQPGTTYLMVGSDARKGLAGRRTDSIMLMHVGEGPTLLMSIPRDSLVEIPGYGVNKINAAFAWGGARLLVRTIERETGIRIDEYVEIGFVGFKKIIDALGGIEICPKERMVDRLAHLDIRRGCQNADGKTALAYSRSRHTSALGDIDRARRQREVVSAVGHGVVAWGSVLNPFQYYRLAFASAESFRLGEDTSAIDAAKFAWAMTHVDKKTGLTCGVPIADLAVHWDRTRANKLFKIIREDRTEDVTPTLCQPSGLAK